LAISYKTEKNLVIPTDFYYGANGWFANNRTGLNSGTIFIRAFLGK